MKRKDEDIEARKFQEPWICKPLELLSHAELHYKAGREADNDYNKRISYISFDQSIEVSILTYMQKNCKPKGSRRYEEKDISDVKGNFYKKIKMFLEIAREKIAQEKNSTKKEEQEKRLSVLKEDTIMHYHDHRNTLYHGSELCSPDKNNLDNIRRVAIWVFSVLFFDISKTALDKLIVDPEKTFPSILDSYAKPKVEGIEKEDEYSLFSAAILGKWNEFSSGDSHIIRKLISGFQIGGFDTWLNSVRDINNYNAEIFSLRDGHWQVKNKKSFLEKYASFFYDSHLDLIREVAVEVLSERHPVFDLSQEKRFAAAIYNKVPKYSPELQKGIAETLVFLDMNGELLENCTQHKPSYTVVQTIREIFDNADWKLWASLNGILPILAEALPDGFLTVVKQVLRQSPCLFDELFKQESVGITGTNYMTGLYWALECLAWSEKYLAESIRRLGELAARDPDEGRVNRAAHSISKILVPWFPQTVAPVEKRIAAMKALQTSHPEVAQDILLSFLPNQHQTSMGSYKPKFKPFISEDWKKEVTNKEYWQQVKKYASMAVEMAKGNIEYALQLVGNLDNIPNPAYKRFLEHLSSKEITELSDEQKQSIWEGMDSFIRKHRRFFDAKWALTTEEINLLEKRAKALAPKDPVIHSRYLFANSDPDFPSEETDWETRQRIMQSERIKALEKVYAVNGTESIIALAEKSECAWEVGCSFAQIADEENDKELLPAFLADQKPFKEQFINSYVAKRYEKEHGLEWLEKIDISDWTDSQKCKLLLFLPFKNEIWEKADELLGTNSSDYWESIKIAPFSTQSNLVPTINKFLEYNRPYLAIQCIFAHYYSKKEFLKEQAEKAFIDSISPASDASMNDFYNTDYYVIAKVLKMLQDAPDVEEDKLCTIEWHYLLFMRKLFITEYKGARPKYLEQCLAQNPEFFIEIIQLAYRSKKEREQPREEIDRRNPSSVERAWDLLSYWKQPPGQLDDGSFSKEVFKKWYEEVKTKTIESGHYEVAMEHLGRVLFYSAADESGLWIQKSVAEVLDERENECMREGFSIEIVYSRGAYFTDPSGEPEKELASRWRQRADEVENEGFVDFASSLKESAKFYEREAERAISEHKSKKNNSD